MRRFLQRAALLLPLAIPAGAQDRKGPTELLWRPPATMTSQDWICGPGGCGRAPTPPYRFLRQEGGGTTPKMLVRDGNGRTWSVKFGAKVIPECFAARYLTALGYTVEPTYLVTRSRIEKVGRVRMAVRHAMTKDGGFAKARFQLRDEKFLVFLPHHAWGWNANPFTSTPQLAGLKILMMLLSNWDAKDARDGDEANDAEFRTSDSGRPEILYSFFDWGGSLGRWGGALRRDQSDCAGFAADTPHFVEGVRNGEVVWGFLGKHARDLKAGITIADVRWLLPYLERITPEDLRAAFTASGATPRQTLCWSVSIENRIHQLQEVVARAAERGTTQAHPETAPAADASFKMNHGKRAAP